MLVGPSCESLLLTLIHLASELGLDWVRNIRYYQVFGYTCKCWARTRSGQNSHISRQINLFRQCFGKLINPNQFFVPCHDDEIVLLLVLSLKREATSWVWFQDHRQLNRSGFMSCQWRFSEFAFGCWLTVQWVVTSLAVSYYIIPLLLPIWSISAGGFSLMMTKRKEQTPNPWHIGWHHLILMTGMVNQRCVANTSNYKSCHMYLCTKI